jgi:osmotically inducible protein OsmC
VRTARERRITVSDSTVTARIGIGRFENGGFGPTVALAPALPGERSKGELLVQTLTRKSVLLASNGGNIAVSVTLS